MITHSVGLSLGAASSIESGVAVREIATGKLIYVDKLFSINDVQLFFDNYTSLKNSVICVSLPYFYCSFYFLLISAMPALRPPLPALRSLLFPDTAAPDG